MKLSHAFAFGMLLFLGFIIPPTDALAQCVNCRPSRNNSDILVCVPSSSGGRECQSTDQTCVISAPCPGSRPPIGGTLNLQQVIDIDASFIKEIGTVHPRFAYALAFLHKRGLLGSNSTVYMIPRIITQSEVDEELGLSDHTRQRGPLGLRERENLSLSDQVRPDRRTESELVVYDVAVEEISNSVATLRLQVQTTSASDPKYSVLEIDLLTDRNTGKWRASSWRIR